MATQTRSPTGDSTRTGTWTGTDGTRYTLLNDHPDSAGSSSTTCSANGVILFTRSAFTVPAGSTINFVNVHYYDLKNGGPQSQAGARILVGGTAYDASTHNPNNGAWTLRTDTFTQNPRTSASWTVDDVNGVGANALTTFGINVTDSSPTVGIASILLEVDYTPSIKDMIMSGIIPFSR